MIAYSDAYARGATTSDRNSTATATWADIGEWEHLFVIDEEKPKKKPNLYHQRLTWRHIQREHSRVKVKTDRLGDFG